MAATFRKAQQMKIDYELLKQQRDFMNNVVATEDQIYEDEKQLALGIINLLDDMLDKEII